MISFNLWIRLCSAVLLFFFGSCFVNYLMLASFYRARLRILIPGRRLRLVGIGDLGRCWWKFIHAIVWRRKLVLLQRCLPLHRCRGGAYHHLLLRVLWCNQGKPLHARNGRCSLLFVWMWLVELAAGPTLGCYLCFFIEWSLHLQTFLFAVLLHCSHYLHSRGCRSDPGFCLLPACWTTSCPDHESFQQQLQRWNSGHNRRVELDTRNCKSTIVMHGHSNARSINACACKILWRSCPGL